MADMVIMWCCPQCKAGNTTVLDNDKMFIECSGCKYFVTLKFEKVERSNLKRVIVRK